MRTVTVKNRTYDIPTNWDDVNIKRFQESILLKSTNPDAITDERIMSIISGLDLNQTFEVSTAKDLDESLKFLQTEVTYDEAPIVIDGTTYEIMALEDITYFQNITIEGRIAQKKNNLAGVMAVLLKPVGIVDWKFEKTSPEFLKSVEALPITKVFGTYMYYFTFIQNLSKEFKELFKKKMKLEMEEQITQLRKNLNIT